MVTVRILVTSKGGDGEDKALLKPHVENSISHEVTNALQQCKTLKESPNEINLHIDAHAQFLGEFNFINDNPISLPMYQT